MIARFAPVLLAVPFLAAVLCGCNASPTGADLSPAAAALAGPAAGLRTTGWGVTGGRLSILVRNDGSELVRSARAVITARDTHGNAVATTSGPIQCCGIAQLAPGATSGLYTDLGAPVRRVARVTVRYAEVALAPPTAASNAAAVAVTDVALQTGGASTVVTARLAVDAGQGAESVRGQAVLTTVSGRIVAVLSQPVACLAPGRPRDVQLRLGARVPAGTIVSSVTTAPMADRSC